MLFTDEDIKRMRDWVTYAEHKFNGQRLDEFVFELQHNEVKDILARLEAAEAVIKRSALWHDGECEMMNGVMRCEEDCDCGSYKAQDEWMRICGKRDLAEGTSQIVGEP